MHRLIRVDIFPFPSGQWSIASHTQPNNIQLTASDTWGKSNSTTTVDGIRRSHMFLDDRDPSLRGDVWTTDPNHLRQVITEYVDQTFRDQSAQYDPTKPDRNPWTMTALAIRSQIPHRTRKSGIEKTLQRPHRTQQPLAHPNASRNNSNLHPNLLQSQPLRQVSSFSPPTCLPPSPTNQTSI